MSEEKKEPKPLEFEPSNKTLMTALEMHLILKQNPNKWFEVSELVKEIKKRNPMTFSLIINPMSKFPMRTYIAAKWLEKKGWIKIKKDQYGNCSYKHES
jgi:hypothetical protein